MKMLVNFEDTVVAIGEDIQSTPLGYLYNGSYFVEPGLKLIEIADMPVDVEVQKKKYKDGEFSDNTKFIDEKTKKIKELEEELEKAKLL